MMHDFQLQGWHFQYDAYRTRAFYEQLPPLQTPLAENFMATFCSFPPELASLLKLMGANPAHPYQMMAGRCHLAEQEGEYILSYPIRGHAYHNTTKQDIILDIASVRLCVQPRLRRRSPVYGGTKTPFAWKSVLYSSPGFCLRPRYRKYMHHPVGNGLFFPIPNDPKQKAGRSLPPGLLSSYHMGLFSFFPVIPKSGYQ